MAWFLKGNSRRFFRIDTSLQFFILPKEQKIIDEDIYFNGISYVNESYEIKSLKLKSQILKEIELIKEKNDFIEEIINEIIKKTEYFIKILKQISRGHNVLSDPSYWINKNHYIRNIDLINAIKESSPRSYSVLSTLEEKLISRINSLLKNAEGSSLKEIYAEYLEHGFTTDTLMESMRANQSLKKVPIARLFIALSDYVDNAVSIYESFNNDHLLANDHAFWPMKEVNVSACGVAIKDSRLFNKFELVYIKIYNPRTDEVLIFEGKILSSSLNKDNLMNFTAIEFIFPQSKEQLCLLSYLQLIESEKAMEAYNAWNQS